MKDATHVATHCFDVLVDNDDLGTMVPTKVFAEEMVGIGERIAKDDDSIGTKICFYLRHCIHFIFFEYRIPLCEKPLRNI